MLGLRTPVKTPRLSPEAVKTSLPSAEEMAQLTQTPEMGEVTSDFSLPPSSNDAASSPKPNAQDMPLQGGGAASRKKGATLDQTFQKLDSPGLETTKPRGRVAEAKACLVKAKLQLNNSRNLKAEIKTEVLWAIENLYRLVKEAEMARPLPASTTGPDHDKTKEPQKSNRQGACGKGAVNAKGDTADLARALEEHKKLILENTAEMKRLKGHLDRNTSATQTASVPHEKDTLATEVMSELLQQREMAAVTRQDLGDIKQQMVHLNQNLQERTATYANVASTAPGRRGPERIALHSVVVSAKDKTISGDEVLSQIRETINAKEGWIKVDRVRKAKDRKVIVGCSTEEGRQKIKERLGKAGDRLQVEDIQNKDPLLILRDVLQYNSDEDIKSALRNQNRSLFQDIGNEDRLEIRFRRKSRNPHANHVVIRVSPKLWLRMTEAEAVHIDLQKIRVADFSPLVQCSLCLGYGHGRRFCKDTVAKCSHCGGPHMKLECADWLANVTPKCCNCTLAKMDQTDHNAFSQECPVRRKWDTLARASIAYC